MDNLTVVIPFRDGHATIERLLRTLPTDLPILVIDDCSVEPFHDPGWTHLRTVRLEQRGYFSGAVNRGLAECTTDVLVLNQDVWHLPGWNWEEWLDHERRLCAMVGDGVFGHPAWPKGYVQGTWMFMRRDAIQSVGPLNAHDYPLWGATCEWQLRACRQGYHVHPLRLPFLAHERQGPYGSSIRKTLQDQPHLQKWLVRTPPMVSVIITNKNYGCFVGDAMASLLGGNSILGPLSPQTFQSFEVILVDYGSDDPHELDDWDNPWKGIHVFKIPDKGTANAMNAAIAASHGKYITPLDADDLMETERLEVLYRSAQDFPHHFLYDDIRVVNRSKGEPFQRRERWEMPPYDFDTVLEKNGAHKGIFYPKRAWEETGGYPEIFDNGREDWAFNIALGIRGYCGVHLPQPLYLYRRADHNRTRFNTAPKFHNEYVAKLQSVFGRIYAGERPMGCCGGSRSKTVRNPVTAAPKTKGLIGATGMQLLEYGLPDKMRERPFQGAATGQYYYFGSAHARNWVDSRDVPGFLEFMGGRAFQVLETV